MAKNNVRVLLLDIEGTTTPIDFVYNTLFPFARKHMHEFLLRHGEDGEALTYLEALRIEYEKDLADHEDPPDWEGDQILAATNYALWLMDRDRKSTALKWLQGSIWKEGYDSGELRGIVYDDVPEALQRWRDEGRRIAIYSSGSILAQRLIFSHTKAGDLTQFISSYFDTTTGPKKDAQSYRAIAHALAVGADQVLFYSDALAEVDAARAAGMLTAMVVREGAPPENCQHPVVRSLLEEIS